MSQLLTEGLLDKLANHRGNTGHFLAYTNRVDETAKAALCVALNFKRKASDKLHLIIGSSVRFSSVAAFEDEN